uniref:Si:ch211-255i3.4 n=1 Tax=Pygocentrus nattereri TaxID=42514 RepID=A0A3B4EAT5_PYGNA
MTELEPVLDFASSGRSGRRNALPDILGSPAGVPPDLSLKLAELSLTGNLYTLKSNSRFLTYKQAKTWEVTTKECFTEFYLLF